MPDTEKHPRRIQFRDREKEARSGIDFGRHMTAPRAPRATQLVVLLALIVVIGGYVGSRVLREAGSGATPPAAAVDRPFGPFSPSGEAVREGLVFSWGPHPVASGYELVLEDGEGRTVWAARLGRETTSLALPPDLSGTLEPGRPYLWRVTAELPDRERETSRGLAFVPR
jgi:hypothetical protein